jgi:hypothetical protein
MLINTNIELDKLIANLKKALEEKYNLILKDLKVRELIALTLDYKNANTMLAMNNKPKVEEDEIEHLNNVYQTKDVVFDITDDNLGIGIIDHIRDVNGQKLYSVDFGYDQFPERLSSEIKPFESGDMQFNADDESAIKATIVTDDNNITVELNIVEYVKSLYINNLRDLYENPSCSTESDDVYRFFEYIGELDIISSYLAYHNEKDDGSDMMGFSLSVDEDSLLKWIETHTDML